MDSLNILAPYVENKSITNSNTKFFNKSYLYLTLGGMDLTKESNLKFIASLTSNKGSMLNELVFLPVIFYASPIESHPYKNISFKNI